MTRFNRYRQVGVGLIEVLIALVVIGVGVIAIVALNADLMSGSGLAKARMEALDLAEEKIEELLPHIDEMVEEGLVTMEKVRVIKYRANGPQ